MATSARLALFLLHLPRVGRVRLRGFLSHLAALGREDVPPTDSLRLLGLSALSSDDVDSAIARSDALLESCRALQVTVHVFGSQSYPAQLSRLANPPAVLFSGRPLRFRSQPARCRDRYSQADTMGTQNGLKHVRPRSLTATVSSCPASRSASTRLPRRQALSVTV